MLIRKTLFKYIVNMHFSFYLNIIPKVVHIVSHHRCAIHKVQVPVYYKHHAYYFRCFKIKLYMRANTCTIKVESLAL